MSSSACAGKYMLTEMPLLLESVFCSNLYLRRNPSSGSMRNHGQRWAYYGCG